MSRDLKHKKTPITATSNATPPITPPAIAPAWWLWCVDAAEAGNAPDDGDKGVDDGEVVAAFVPVDILGEEFSDVVSSGSESVGVDEVSVPVEVVVGDVVEDGGEPVGATVGTSVGVSVGEGEKGRMLRGREGPIGGKVTLPGGETIGGVSGGGNCSFGPSIGVGSCGVELIDPGKGSDGPMPEDMAVQQLTMCDDINNGTSPSIITRTYFWPRQCSVILSSYQLQECPNEVNP